MKVSIRFINCNQMHKKDFQNGVRGMSYFALLSLPRKDKLTFRQITDRFYTDLCSSSTKPVIKILLERCMRLFLNLYLITKFKSTLFKNQANEKSYTIPQIEQLVEAMTSITLENKQNGRLRKAFMVRLFSKRSSV